METPPRTRKTLVAALIVTGALALIIHFQLTLGDPKRPSRTTTSDGSRTGAPKPPRPPVRPPDPPPPIADEHSPAGKAITLWRSIHDGLVAKGWGQRFGHYCGAASEIAEIGRLYAADPAGVGAALRAEYEATSEITTRTVLGLVLMLVREQGEPFLLCKVDQAEDPFDKLYLCHTLSFPKELFPPGTDPKKPWIDLLYLFAMEHGNMVTMAENEAAGAWPYGRPVGPADPAAAAANAVPSGFQGIYVLPNGTIEDKDWKCPAWYSSPAVVEEFKRFALNESDLWLRYKMFRVIANAAEAGDRSTAMWMLSQLQSEWELGGNAWGTAIVYGALRGLGPTEAVRPLMAFIIENEGSLDVGYVTDAIADTQGNAAWPEVERGYWLLKTPEAREAVLTNYFSPFHKTTPPDAIPLLRREALESSTPAIRAAAVRALTPKNYPDSSGFRDILVRSLHDNIREVRTAAAMNAGDFRLREAVPDLIALCPKAGSKAEFEWYYQALQKIAPESAREIPPYPQTPEEPTDESGTEEDR